MIAAASLWSASSQLRSAGPCLLLSACSDEVGTMAGLVGRTEV